MSEGVTDLGKYRVSRRGQRVHGTDAFGGACAHLRTTMDPDGLVVRCDDCGDPLAPYWVLERLLVEIDRAWKRIKQRRAALDELDAKRLVFRVAKGLETAWRSRSTLPACPHCLRGLEATDSFPIVSREIERARRARKTGG